MNNKTLNLIYLVILISLVRISTFGFKKSEDTYNFIQTRNRLTSMIKTTGCDSKTLGIEGKCAYSSISETKKYLSDLPTIIQKGWTTISEKIPADKFLFCRGDWTGQNLVKDQQAGITSGCENLPLQLDKSFGTFAYNFEKLKCGSKTVDSANMCIAFDKCGTLAFTMNLGLVQCAQGLAESVKIGPMSLGFDVPDNIENIGVGFSLTKSFYNEAKLGYLVNGVLSKSTDVIFRGQVFFEIGTSLPTKYIDDIIGKEGLVSLSAQTLFLLDFGDIEANIKNAISLLSNADSSSAKSAISQITELGRELSVIIDGTGSIALESLTGGMISDMEFTFTEITWLLTRGGGSSGADMGLYFSAGSTMVENLVDIVKQYMTLLKPILSKLGLSTNFTVPEIGLYLYFFATKVYLGFKIEAPSIDLNCKYRYSDKNFSCQFNSKFFSMIASGANYLFKEATSFFETNGKELLSQVANSWKITSKAVSTSIKAGALAYQKLKNSRITSAVTKVVSNIVSNVVNSNTTQNVVSTVKDKGSSVVSSSKKLKKKIFG